MKNGYLLLIASIFIITNSFGQITFQKTYGGANSDLGQSIQQTNDGGYIITGYTSSFGAGGSDVYLVKTDATGNITWTRTYGGAGDDIGKAVRQTSDGGYIIAGWTTSFGQGGGGDIYYIKVDANGNLVWSKTFGGPSQDLAFSVQQTDDGGYAIFGWTTSYGAGDGDYYLVKTDANGNVQWNKTYGWSGDEYGLWIQQTTDHGYIMTGTSNSKGAGLFDVLIIKTDSAGNETWAQTYGGAMNDGGSFIQQTSDGGYINVGNTQSFGAGSNDVYLIRTDANGDTLWTRTYGGVNKDGGNCVRQDAAGNFTIAATYASGATSQGWLFKTDGNGTPLWNRFYGGANSEESFTYWPTNDEGYVLTGYTTSFGAGMDDIYIIKTDSLAKSGCNDTTQQISITKFPPTIVTSPVPIVMSGGIATNPATKVDSGGTPNLLCASSINVPLPSFQSSDTTLCANDCISFKDLSANNPTSWQWSFPGGTPSSSTDQNPSYICYLTGGSYNVTLIATNANGNNTLTLNNFIVVDPAPPTPDITDVNDTLLECSTDPSYISYQWYDNSTMIPGATDTLLKITHGGNYNVKVTNANGCSIAVGINVVGIDEFTVSGLQLTFSPNPVEKELIIIPITSGVKSGSERIVIYNVLGQEASPPIPLQRRGENTVIDVSKLTSGIYFVQVVGEKQRWVGRFVKE